MKDRRINLFRLRRELDGLKEELRHLPEGHLGQKGSYFYHIIKDKQIAITRKPLLIQQLCRKKYVQARIAQLDNNLYRPRKKFDDSLPQDLVATFPRAYQNTPIEYFYHATMSSWLGKAPTANSIAPEQRKYTSAKGIAFRSMSELRIAEVLDHYELPYRYDTVINLGDTVVSPDFIIKNPYSGKTVIWEHFGAFQHEKYADSMIEKLDFYMEEGYILLENFISTYAHHLRNPQRLKDLIEEIILA